MTDKVLNEQDTAKGSVKTLIIIRGLPGSGKSKLAEMINFYYDVVDPEAVSIHEADQYFVKDGIYKFNPLEIPNAHRMCYNNTKDSLVAGREVVIVSNTATRRWEFEKYIAIAREHGYKVQVIDVHGEFENVHGVPEEHLTKMAERWEPFDRELLSSRYGE